MSRRCMTCNLTLNSVAQFDQHMTGKGHAKKLKKLTEDGQGSAVPAIKQINFVKQQGDQAGQTPSGTDPSAAPSTTGTEDETYCELCMLKLNSAEQARIHYSGTKHLRKLKLSRQYYKEGASAQENGGPNGTFFCGFCNITVNSAQQMELHREGSKHRRMVEGMMKRQAGDGDGAGPAPKRPALADPTNNIPQMYPGSSTACVQPPSSTV